MASAPRILIVDDDPIVADSLAEFMEHEGYTTVTAGDGQEALEVLDQYAHCSGSSGNGSGGGSGGSSGGGDEPIGLVVTDINMPRCSGLELLKTVRKKYSSLVVIVITGFGKIETAVEAVKLGAADYLTKPLIDDELRISVSKAMQQHALLAENQTLKSQLTERYGMGNIVGSDYRMQRVYDLIEAVAESKTTVLIEGDSGTGKSMVAKAVHAQSPRRGGPFVTFSCGAIPETLLESELFGHVKGAFTGADVDKPGRCLAANGGTLFIDEINSATPALQLKLLRVLQDKQFEPVGSTKTVEVDVRFVLASNRPLLQLVEAGKFREDLYYRINVVNIHLPPLRDRTSDIPLLVQRFLEKYRKETGKERSLNEEAQAALTRYHWPGNVRELENAVERSVVLSRQPVIGLEDLPDSIRDRSTGRSTSTGNDTNNGSAPGNGHDAVIYIPALENGWTPTALSRAMEDPEKQILLAALRANGWNRQVTASQLDINRTTLYKKIKQYGLDTIGE